MKEWNETAQVWKAKTDQIITELIKPQTKSSSF